MTALIAIIIAILFIVIIYNSLVAKRNKVDEIFSTMGLSVKKKIRFNTKSCGSRKRIYEF